jgi:hypothetical protein
MITAPGLTVLQPRWAYGALEGRIRYWEQAPEDGAVRKCGWYSAGSTGWDDPAEHDTSKLVPGAKGVTELSRFYLDPEDQSETREVEFAMKISQVIKLFEEKVVSIERWRDRVRKLSAAQIGLAVAATGLAIAGTVLTLGIGGLIGGIVLGVGTLALTAKLAHDKEGLKLARDENHNPKKQGRFGPQTRAGVKASAQAVGVVGVKTGIVEGLKSAGGATAYAGAIVGSVAGIGGGVISAGMGAYDFQKASNVNPNELWKKVDWEAVKGGLRSAQLSLNQRRMAPRTRKALQDAIQETTNKIFALELRNRQEALISSSHQNPPVTLPPIIHLRPSGPE